MAKYDKYEPLAGGFRAHLATALTLGANGGIGPVGVSLDANGRVVVGTGGQSGLIGVLVKNAARGPIYQWNQTLQGAVNGYSPVGTQAGDVVDVMTAGEIVDLDPTVFVAGTKFYVHADGSIDATATAGTAIGFTTKAGHLIVRFAV